MQAKLLILCLSISSSIALFTMPSLPSIQLPSLPINLQVLDDPLDGNIDTNEGRMDFKNTLTHPEISDVQHYASLAASAYCSEKSLKISSCPLCPLNSNNITIYRVVQSIFYNTFGFVAVDNTKNTIVISLRGSYNVQNYIQDSDMSLMAWPTNSSFKIHKGFYKAMKSLYPEIKTALDELLNHYPENKVVITGHSLGGAMAALLIFQLIVDDGFSPNTFESFTYGEPRQGNRAYVNKFNSFGIKSARVVQYKDVIPHLVPAELGYYHRQNEVWVKYPKSNTAIYCNETVYEDSNCSNSFGPYYNLLDHLVYMGIDINFCAKKQPCDFIFNFIIPLPEFIPSALAVLRPLLNIFCSISLF